MIPIRNRRFDPITKSKNIGGPLNSPKLGHVTCRPSSNKKRRVESAINDIFLNKNIFKASDILTNKKKICNYLDENPSAKVLFIFDHGLGDVIMFLNLLENIKIKYPCAEFKIGINENMQLAELSPNIVPLTPNKSLSWNESYFLDVSNRYDLISIKDSEKYDFIFEIAFPENNNKQLTCVTREFGFKQPLNYDLLNLYHGEIIPKNQTRTIGLHFTSNSGVGLKSLNLTEAQKLFEIIRKIGYNPVVFDLNFKNKNPDAILSNMNWVPSKNKINPNSSLTDLMKIMAQCRYVIGVTSGIICMAQNVLGDDRCVHLNKWGHKLSHFLPTNMIDLWPISENKLKVILR